LIKSGFGRELAAQEDNMTKKKSDFVYFSFLLICLSLFILVFIGRGGRF